MSRAYTALLFLLLEVMRGGAIMDLYIDVSKALNRARLVQREVQVHGHNGKMFMRRQWVDPNTGQPVMEDSHPEHEDHHFRRLSGLNDAQRGELARNYYGQSMERAHNFAYHTHMPLVSEGSYMGTVRHIEKNLHKIPHAQIIDHLNRVDPVNSGKIGYVPVRHAPLGLKHTDHGLPEQVVKHRHGEFGPVDMSQLSHGTKLSHTNYVTRELDDSQRRADTPYNINHYQNGNKMDVLDHFNAVFGDITMHGLQHVFSVPDLGVTAHLDGIAVNYDEGFVGSEINMVLRDEDGDSMGNITRIFHRDEQGHLHVDNSYFSLKGSADKGGMGKHIYARQEQLYRHMSQGHPVHIKISANISIGKYAWAVQGFDFEDKKKGPRGMQNDLVSFCDANGITLNDLLKQNNYHDLKDIKHPWEFAVLDDGADWILRNINTTLSPDDARAMKSTVKGTGHFGKAFMLGGVDYWLGKRTLNDNSLEEQIYDPLKNHIK